MDIFTKIVIATVVVILLIYYYRQWAAFRKEQKLSTWPPVIYACPDYWTAEPKAGNPKLKVCKNTHDLGVCPSVDGVLVSQGQIDFNAAKFQPKNKQANIKKKCEWARKCGVSWDGIDDKC